MNLKLKLIFIMFSALIMSACVSTKEYNAVLVDRPPVYPGCEDREGNDAINNCFSQKVNKLVRKNFNSNVASENGLTGRLSIGVSYHINKEGKVGQVNVSGPHPALIREGERVIKKLPVMQAGRKDGKPVVTKYYLPIKFIVAE